jgi:anti-sigma B factor antagonist
VLDGVGAGFAGGNQDILEYERVQAQLAEPAAQFPPDGRKLVRVGWKGQVQRGGPGIQQDRDVVLVTLPGGELRHDLPGQVVHGPVAARPEQGGGLGHACIDRAVATLPAEIGLSNAPAVQEGLLSVLSRRPAALIADMTPTIFCDSAGVRALMLAYKQAVAMGCELRLVISSAGVKRVFALIGADQLVEVHEQLDGALGPVVERQHDGV